MQALKAIETHYKGYRFRSRLEARWAVYFDAVGIKWEYEKEGYDLDGIRYLPDFWLPQVGMWAEVKAEAFTPSEYEAIRRLVMSSGFPALKLIGIPDWKPYDGVYYEDALPDEECAKRFTEYDHLLTDRYLDDEGRFFVCCGYSSFPWDVEKFQRDYWDQCAIDAVALARGARFEHAERETSFIRGRQ